MANEPISNGKNKNSIVFSFKPFKAPGYDGIYPVFLQKVFPLIGGLLCMLFETSLEQVTFQNLGEKVESYSFQKWEIDPMT